jgi:hypothetical protein
MRDVLRGTTLLDFISEKGVHLYVTFYVWFMKAVVPAFDPASGRTRDVSLEVWAAQQELPYFVKVSFLNQS